MSDTDSAEAYFSSRLQYDDKRTVLWSTLWEHSLSKVLRGSSTILELGAGWCDFINNARAPRRIAVDLWPGVVEAAAPGVEAHVGAAEDLGFVEDASVDAVFASNLVEHLTHEQFDAMLLECDRVLVEGGRVALVQPNFRLAYKNYFDDYTHVTMWSDASLPDFLSSRGWEIERVEARYMPLSVKSRFPVSSLLIRAYLASPLKPLAGQMLVVARKPRARR